MTFGAGLFLLLTAPAIGSFLAVLVDRLPRAEPVAIAPSRCRACQIRLTARDLVPVVSWVLLRGRCRHCLAPLPQWLVLMELAALGLAVLALLNGGDPWQIWTTAGFLWLLLALAVSDLLWLRLPDLLTGALAALSLGVAWPSGLLPQALAGAALGAGSFWAIRVGYRGLRGREGLGLGDVKLMIGLGAATGPFGLPWLVLLAALCALAVALLPALLTRRRPRADLPLPFGAALCASAAMLWLLGNGMILV